MGKIYGVYFSEKSRKWLTTLVIDGVATRIGEFDTWDEAMEYWRKHEEENKRVRPDGAAEAIRRSTEKLRSKGVSFCTRSGKWRAAGRMHGQVASFGYFDTAQEARDAYEKGMGLQPSTGIPDLAVGIAGMTDRYVITPDGEVWDTTSEERIKVTNGRFRVVDGDKVKLMTISRALIKTFGKNEVEGKLREEPGS